MYILIFQLFVRTHVYPRFLNLLVAHHPSVRILHFLFLKVFWVFGIGKEIYLFFI